MSIVTALLGYPRIGAKRELKHALESYWSEEATAEQLLSTATQLRSRHWTSQREAGIDVLPCNDFSLYDTVLDTAVMVGAVPERFQQLPDLDAYFAMARGDVKRNLTALSMKKWFDTNYHYIVPEISETETFSLQPSKLLSELRQARQEGFQVRPVVLGPVTLLYLSQNAPLHRLSELLTVYAQLLEELHDEDVEWVQLDEPVLTLELSPELRQAYEQALPFLLQVSSRPNLMLSTYFGGLAENIQLLKDASPEGLHLDLVRAPEGLGQALSALPLETVLSLGVIDGRNIWKTDLRAAQTLLDQALMVRSKTTLQLAPSCSLLHVPFDLNLETGLDSELLSWMAFARQKMEELGALACNDPKAIRLSDDVTDSRRQSVRLNNSEVRETLASVDESWLTRKSTYSERIEIQKKRFALPTLPATTIGSFPQTDEVRRKRAEWRNGNLMETAYQEFLREEIQDCLSRQEKFGLDVLVHGEFERTDMVEHFGQRLEGFAFTSNGWVQSYGSRCVKPPVLFGDVSRPEPMTVEWIKYAQSLTERPVKGMLTGPVTILQWSFVRDDQPRSETCRQIALALRSELSDLEKAGIGMIQVDEPAIREGLPLREANWEAYLRWAVDCFRLSTAGVGDDVQIQTHMCYSEFSDILSAVQAMDSDVLFIETSRSRMELLSQLDGYLNDIGPGVYDIHSPRIPSVDEIVDNLKRALFKVPPSRLWVNPDCGLKTRSWPEVESALQNMTEAARRMRESILSGT